MDSARESKTAKSLNIYSVIGNIFPLLISTQSVAFSPTFILHCVL
jgi:hypothetical protein